MSARTRILALLTCFVLVATACGTRRDLDELLAAANTVEAPADDGEFAAVDPGADAAPQTDAGEAATPDAAPQADPSSSGGGGDTPAATTPGQPAATTAPAADAGGGGDGSAGGGGGGPARANKAPVVIGTVATTSGPVGDLVKGAIEGLQVWVQDVNSRGGLNGHPVQYSVVDDGGDPSRYQALMREMVEDQGAIAFLYNTLGFGAAQNTAYNEQNRIPIIGHEGGTEAGYDNPMVFTATSAGNNYAHALMNGLADVIKPQGMENIAVLACSDVKLCDIFFDAWTGPAAEKHGFNVVYTARPSLTQPDFTSECLAAKDAGADAIIAAIDNNSYIRLGNSCNRQQYEPIVGIADQLALPSVAQADSLQGSVVSSRLVPWVSTDDPAVAELHQAFAKFMPGTEVNGAHIGGWAYGKLLEEAAANLPDDPTSEDVLDGLYALDSNLGGLTYRLNFDPNTGSPRRTCWSSVVIENKQFTAPFGEQRCE